jgi:hypothetical protein
MSGPMANVVSREAYFQTGLGVLSDLGYGVKRAFSVGPRR